MHPLSDTVTLDRSTLEWAIERFKAEIQTVYDDPTDRFPLREALAAWDARMRKIARNLGLDYNFEVKLMVGNCPAGLREIEEFQAFLREA